MAHGPARRGYVISSATAQPIRVRPTPRSQRDLPVLQVTKIEMVINMKTAKFPSLTIPQSILTRADDLSSKPFR